jgi:glycosyltransferase involved in cell wall biosynthesis
MSLGKPVIVSDAKPLARVASESGGGVIFGSDDAHQLAEAILALRDEDRQGEMGDNGRQFVLNDHNWKHSAQTLLSLYSELERPKANCESS